MLHNGVIAEDGTKENLMMKRGLYYQMAWQQSGLGVNASNGQASISPARITALWLFAAAQDTDLEPLAKMFVSRRVAAGELLYEAGDMGSECVVVVTGSIKREKHLTLMERMQAENNASGRRSRRSGSRRTSRQTTTRTRTQKSKTKTGSAAARDDRVAESDEDDDNDEHGDDDENNAEKGNSRALTYQPGESFGEQWLLGDEKLEYDYRAVTSTIVLTLARSHYQQILESTPALAGPVRQLLAAHDAALTPAALRRAWPLVMLQDCELSSVAQAFKVEVYEANTQVFSPEGGCGGMYCVAHGHVRVVKARGVVKTYTAGEFFGHETLVGLNTEGLYESETVSKCVILHLTWEAFQKILENSPPMMDRVYGFLELVPPALFVFVSFFFFFSSADASCSLGNDSPEPHTSTAMSPSALNVPFPGGKMSSPGATAVGAIMLTTCSRLIPSKPSGRKGSLASRVATDCQSLIRRHTRTMVAAAPSAPPPRDALLSTEERDSADRNSVGDSASVTVRHAASTLEGRGTRCSFSETRL